MKNINQLSTIVRIVALTFSLSALPALAEKAEGVALDGTFKVAERAKTMLKVTNADAPGLKTIQRAAISSFQVEFVTKGAAGASSYEIGKSGSASTNLQITLVGLGQPDFQAITDQLYTEFVRDLTAMKIEVLPAERVLSSAAYKKMAASGKPSPAETRTKDTWSTVYAPQGLAVYGVGSSSSAIALLAGFSAMSDVSSTMFGNQDLAKELDAALLVVRMVVNFVDLQSSNSSFFGRSSGTATVSWKFGPSVAGQSTTMAIHHAGTQASMALNAPLLIDGAAFKELKDTTSVAANIGLALLSAAIGKGGSASAVEKEAVADPQQYRTLVGNGLGTVREMFMQTLQSNR